MGRLCEVCDAELGHDPGRCTNGRCGRCHLAWCSPGGTTSPGHARRWPARCAAQDCTRPEGHGPPHLFKCAGPSCPGLPYRASMIAHPSACAEVSVEEAHRILDRLQAAVDAGTIPVMYPTDLEREAHEILWRDFNNGGRRG